MPTKNTSSSFDAAAPEPDRRDDAPLTPEERVRLIAELEAELEEAERSVREEGVVTPDELKRHMDALLRELAEEEEQERRPVKR